MVSEGKLLKNVEFDFSKMLDALEYNDFRNRQKVEEAVSHFTFGNNFTGYNHDKKR